MDFVEQLKSQVDIVKVVGEYVRLRRIGATGRYTGLCPFHQEKTPSFNVNQTQQFYKCFGCNAGGDVLKFVMSIEGLTFPEALKLLAERNGIPMPQRTEYADAESKLRGALLEMHAIAAKLYREALAGPAGGEARAYLSRRGVPTAMSDTFELGYSEPGGQALLRVLSERRFTAEQMEASGLIRKRNESSGHYDAFRGRLMFPIHNESGKVIAFGGRAMRDDDQPKYLNSPETPIYRKTSVLYNLHRAREGMRRTNRAVLVEGYMDVIGVYSAGIKEVVASCGTALTNPQVQAIRRHADTVIVNFDPDNAGANAAERAIQILLDEGLHVKVLSLGHPGEEVKLDPDEFIKQFGPEEYLARLENAASYFHWLADRARERFDMRSPEGRMDVFRFLMPAVQKVQDRLERAAVVNDLASYLGVDAGLVLEQFRRAPAGRKVPPKPAEPRAEIPATERILIHALLVSERVREEALPALTLEVIQGFITREIFEAMLAMAAGGSPLTFSGLEARLPARAQVLLHQAIAADDTEDEEILQQRAQACLRRLATDSLRRQVDDHKARIKAAEREGNFDEVLRLLTELHRLEREARGAA